MANISESKLMEYIMESIGECLNENGVGEVDTEYRVEEINVETKGYRYNNGKVEDMGYSFGRTDREEYTAESLEELIRDIASDYWCDSKKCWVVGNSVYMRESRLKDANGDWFDDQEYWSWKRGESVGFADTVNFTVTKQSVVKSDEMNIAINNLK